MVKIIMNEKEYVEDILFNRKPIVNGTILFHIAKYYYSIGHTRSEVVKLLNEFVARCNPDDSLVAWQDLIERCVNSAKGRPLISIEYVPVTVSEIERIRKISSIRAQKIAFTVLCLAKYQDALNPKNNHWCSFEQRDVFILSGVERLNIRKRGEILYGLKESGLIELSKIVDNTNLHVMITDPEGEVAMKITDFRNLGNQYDAYNHPEQYIHCANCGLVIRRRAQNHKYCSICAASINIMQTAARRDSSEYSA